MVLSMNHSCWREGLAGINKMSFTRIINTAHNVHPRFHYVLTSLAPLWPLLLLIMIFLFFIYGPMHEPDKRHFLGKKQQNNVIKLIGSTY